MRIRNYRINDSARLSEIYLRSRRAAFHWIAPAGLKLSDFDADTKGEVMLVAEVDGKIVGFSSSWMPSKFIHHLHVDPDHVSTGVGSALLQATVERLGSPTRLKCLSQNKKALKFYFAKGWVVVAEGVSEEGAFYEMELAPRPNAGQTNPSNPSLRIILLGNAGSGKTTMARNLIRGRNIPRLSLDEIAWTAGTERNPLEESLRELRRFIDNHDQWIIEGCYGDLVEAALPYCTELRFLNPGIEVCIEHCKRRPWEPKKFSSAEAQQALLEQLLQWVQAYETRNDEYGLKRHREIFDQFAGPKKEYITVAGYDLLPSSNN